MADKETMAQVEKFNKGNLKPVTTEEKNPLPTKETIEQEKSADQEEQQQKK